MHVCIVIYLADRWDPDIEEQGGMGFQSGEVYWGIQSALNKYYTGGELSDSDKWPGGLLLLNRTPPSPGMWGFPYASTETARSSNGRTTLRWRNMRNLVKRLMVILALFGSTIIFAQKSPSFDPALGITTIPLYNGIPPGSQTDQAGVPTLTVFRPQPGRATGSAVVIAPGGGYIALASNLEGRQVADWFTVRGFTAFVLTYRLGRQNLYPIPLQDAQRAIRLVRSLEKNYGIAPNRVGIIGFSAGGHLAAAAATLFDNALPASPDAVDRLSARPDFLILAYPWLNAMEPAQKGEITYCSVLRVLTPEQCSALTSAYTPKLHVTSSTPSTFIYSTSDDATVPVRASVEFYDAMIKAGAPVEMHLFRHGAHGSGLGSADATLDQWPGLLEQWLRDQGLLTVDPAVAAAVPQGVVRKPGAPLTTDSRIDDILKDKAASAAVASICGPDFLANMPKQAQSNSLKTIAPYFPSQLSQKNLTALKSAFQALSSSGQPK